MTYVKNTWVDQQGQVRYTETTDGGYKIFTANYEEVTELGTPVNAANMNHIEDGVEECSNDIASLQSSKLDVSVYTAGIATKADVNLGNANPNATFKANSDYWGMPDYSAGTSVGTGNYTPAKNGFLIGNAKDRSDTTIRVELGNTTIIDSFSTSHEGSNPWCVPLAKGKTYNIGGGSWVRNIFYPCLGG